MVLLTKANPTLCFLTLISYVYSKFPFSIVIASSNHVCPRRTIQSSPPRIADAASSSVFPFIKRCINRNASSTFDFPQAFVPIKNVRGSAYIIESLKDFQLIRCNLVIITPFLLEAKIRLSEQNTKFLIEFLFYVREN
jgi:hypothetical protein